MRTPESMRPVFFVNYGRFSGVQVPRGQTLAVCVRLNFMRTIVPLKWVVSASAARKKEFRFDSGPERRSHNSPASGIADGKIGVRVAACDYC